MLEEKETLLDKQNNLIEGGVNWQGLTNTEFQISLTSKLIF
jgi:hypothetical protein